MPSASAKIEKIPAPEVCESAAKQITNFMEKKVRNLEKRKIKLDNYRSDLENGKELNEDQKIAISKYEQVECLLEQAKEIAKASVTIAAECARQQKKQAKREQLERQQQEVQRLQEAFVYAHILSCFQNEDVRSDFLDGHKGAVQLTSEQLSMLDQFYKMLVPRHPNQHADLCNHFHMLAENHIFLVEGKNKEVAGTTYKVLKELLLAIKDCGYFSRPNASVVEGDETPAEDPEEPLDKLEENHESLDQVPEEVELQQCNNHYEEGLQNADVQEPAAPQMSPLQEVLADQGAFNFLQESQIDLDAPHMDPAVVAVGPMPPSKAFSPPPPADGPSPLVNGHCEGVSSQQAHQPEPPVPLDFDPSHPIPTQTFTNQNFAVMQNMMVGAPVVHPIAMVTGNVSPVHVQVVPVIPVVDDAAPCRDDRRVNGVEEAIANGETNGNGTSERTSDANGQRPFRGGFRGRGQARGGGGYFRGRGNYNGRGGGFQNRFYQDNRNGYGGGGYRRNDNRGPPRGNTNGRGRGGNFRLHNQSQEPQQAQ